MSEGTNFGKERIDALSHEHVDVVAYDPGWPKRFEEEEDRLIRSLPPGLVKQIVHIGSTAVPGLSAKPIIDVQVEVTSLDRVRKEVVPIMEDLGHEYIWRPTMGEHAPFYAWFIRRNAAGRRTHHVHMVEPDEASEDRVLFRDHLRAHPELAAKYETLKRDLADRFPDNRTAYTKGKTDFILEVVRMAREER